MKIPTLSIQISGVFLANNLSTDENCLLATPYDFADLFFPLLTTMRQ